MVGNILNKAPTDYYVTNEHLAPSSEQMQTLSKSQKRKKERQKERKNQDRPIHHTVGTSKSISFTFCLLVWMWV